MRKQALTVSVAIFFSLGSATFIGCANNENNGEEVEQTEENEHAEHENHEGHDHSEEKSVGYQCVMDCEDGKVYDEEGDCPFCEMPLEKLEEEE